MNRKSYLGILIAMFLCLLGTASDSPAADWNYSPYKPQMSERAEQSEQAPVDETATMTGTTKKNIGKGVLFSLIIPGTGQLYSGSWLRALPWLAIEGVGWAMFAKYHGDGQDKTDQFEKFAGAKNSPNNFVYDAYILREYQVAASDAFNTVPYANGLSAWREEPWDVREPYLPPPFTHDINTGDIQQYFEMIGKYYSQFGFGWRDTYPSTANLNDQNAGAIWTDPSQGFMDDEATVEFDGQSPLFFQYRDMRGEANDLLDKGNVAMEIVLVNHVLSALDAAFAVRKYNRSLEGTMLGQMGLNYSARYQDGDVYRGLAASIPLGN